MNQPTAKPTRKMGAVGISGLTMIPLTWIAKEYIGIEIPSDVMVGVTTAVVWGIGYLVPERSIKKKISQEEKS